MKLFCEKIWNYQKFFVFLHCYLKKTDKNIMSKSYSKVKKFGIYTGDNSDFYKKRRKEFKAKDKQAMKDALAHLDVENFDDEYKPHNEVFKDAWMEPTNGTFIRTAKGIIEDYRDGIRGAYITKDDKIKR